LRGRFPEMGATTLAGLLERRDPAAR
jgi:hypothetical protein